MGSVNGCYANELNIDVYNIWKFAKEDNKEFFEKIISYCDESNRNSEYYYEMRDKYNELWREEIVNVERTARFYYLLNSCHSAMVRYGPNGFNTSYKLYLSSRNFNINDKILKLKNYSTKIKKLYNLNSLEMLKSNDLDVNIIYCDPPYTNSSSIYQNNWSDDNYNELIELLKYQYRKKSIVSIISNYSNAKFDIKFDKIINFSINRRAGTKITKSDDILGIIGKIKLNNLESFFE